MTRAQSVVGLLDIRSMGMFIQQNQTSCSQPSGAARRVVYEENSLLSSPGSCRPCGAPPPCSDCRCCKNGVPYNGSGSIFGDSWTPFGRCQGYNPLGAGASAAGQRSSVSKDEDSPGKFDRGSDWAVAFGAFVVIAVVLGLVQSYAVFVPAIQAHYEIGVLEAVLIGCLTYMVLLLFLPLSSALARWIGNRWTGVLGMVLFFLGICLDALVLHVATLYVSHIVLMGIGGSLAYGAAGSVCSDHFRKSLGTALSLISVAPCIGTILFYYLCALLISYVSYQWTKFCIAIAFLLCMAACLLFPSEKRKVRWNNEQASRARLKQCVQNCAQEQPVDCCEEEGGRPKYMCVCVCDCPYTIDYSFLLWAVVSMLSLIAVFVPYLFLLAYALSVGTQYSLATLCWYCVASMAFRVALLQGGLGTFVYYRTLFQAACIGAGVLYICLIWVTTFGWMVAWSLVVGATEGILAICTPILTLKTCPASWIGSAWSWMVISHAVSVITGPMVLMSVYYGSLEYGPGFIALGVAQILAGLFAFLLPNEDGDYSTQSSAQSGSSNAGRGMSSRASGLYGGVYGRDPCCYPYSGYSFGGTATGCCCGSSSLGRSYAPYTCDPALYMKTTPNGDEVRTEQSQHPQRKANSVASKSSPPKKTKRRCCSFSRSRKNKENGKSGKSSNNAKSKNESAPSKSTAGKRKNHSGNGANKRPQEKSKSRSEMKPKKPLGKSEPVKKSNKS